MSSPKHTWSLSPTSLPSSHFLDTCRTRLRHFPDTWAKIWGQTSWPHWSLMEHLTSISTTHMRHMTDTSATRRRHSILNSPIPCFAYWQQLQYSVDNVNNSELAYVVNTSSWLFYRTWELPLTWKHEACWSGTPNALHSLIIMQGSKEPNPQKTAIMLSATIRHKRTESLDDLMVDYRTAMSTVQMSLIKIATAWKQHVDS